MINYSKILSNARMCLFLLSFCDWQSWGFGIKTSYFFRAFSGRKVVTLSQKECLGLERKGISPIIIDWSHSRRFSLPLENIIKPPTNERPFSTYKSQVNQHKCHIFDTWGEFWLEYMFRDELINMRPENCIDYLIWLLDHVSTFWAILELLALVPTWLRVHTWSGTSTTQKSKCYLKIIWAHFCYQNMKMRLKVKTRLKQKLGPKLVNWSQNMKLSSEHEKDFNKTKICHGMKTRLKNENEVKQEIRKWEQKMKLRPK